MELLELKEREIRYFEEWLYLKIKNNLNKKLGIPKTEYEIEAREQLIEELISKNKTMKNKIDDFLSLGLDELSNK